jgi:tetratricopeptide (TPR) repeat protein
VIERLLDAPDEERRAILSDAVVEFGFRLGMSLSYLVSQSESDERFRTWLDESRDLLIQWLGGERLTARVDETERRGVVAAEMLREISTGRMSPGLIRLAADRALELPEDHPARDVATARDAVAVAVDQARAERDPELLVGCAATVANHELRDESETIGLFAEARGVVGDVEEMSQETFGLAEASWHLLRTIDARDREDVDQRSEHAAAGRAALGPLLERDPSSVRFLLILAVLDDADENLAAAAETYRSIADAAESPEIRQSALTQEGRLRNVLGDDERAVEALSAVLPTLRDSYVTAVLAEDVADTGEAYSKAGRNLTHSLARSGRSREAFKTLDELRSLRFRYRQVLRAGDTGRALLELETQIYAADRGVAEAGDEGDDQIDRLVRKATLLRERYRRLLPPVSDAALASPDPESVAGALRDGEAVVFLGVTTDGTIVGGLGPHLSDGLELGLRDDWPIQRWVDLLLAGIEVWAGQVDTWASATRTAATTFLRSVDDDLGPVLRHAVGDARRLFVVPHGLLHLVPWRELPSFRDREVIAYPSLAQLMRVLGAPPRLLTGHVAVISDPTRDLHLSSLEAARVAHHLSPAFGAPRLLAEAAATEEAVGDAVRGACIVHLSAHGRSSPDDPESSGVFLAPAEPFDRDPFSEWVASVPVWRSPEEGRRLGDVPDVGRITETTLDEEAGVFERVLERGPSSTLVAHYRDGSLRALAERWSAGDILVTDVFSGCGLAVLSACETAGVGLSVTLDEFSGLPAALALAGVGTVVASEWPVPEGLAALFVDMFYEGLAGAIRHGAGVRAPVVDVVSLVARITRDLRAMSAADALDRLSSLKEGIDDPSVRLRLEAYAMRVGSAGAHPFKHPFDCATFTAFGAGQLLREAP